MSIHEARTHLSQLVDQAAAGEEIIIARNGRPVARRAPGTLHGRIWMSPDFDQTPDDVIDSFYGDPSGLHGDWRALPPDC